MCLIPLSAQQVLFSLNFSNSSLTPASSGITTLQSLTTSYGTVKYLDLSIYNDSKIYNQITKIGWIDFRVGSTTLGTTNSYIALPALTFSNGGVFSITYGSGSTGKKLRLQEWDGSAWQNGSYAEVSTAQSSTWYQQNWTITGAGTKIFRLVLTSSSPIYISDINVTANATAILVDTSDTINFGTKKIYTQYGIDSVHVTGSLLSGDILVETLSPFKVSSVKTGPFYSTMTLPYTGGTVYVKYQPSSVVESLKTLTLSSTGALNKVLMLKGVGATLSTEKKITSFAIIDNVGVIDETNKTISVVVPWSMDLSLPYTPTVSVSNSATLITTGATYYVAGTPVSYSVMAEDGTISTYQVTITKADRKKDCIISEFILSGKRASIVGSSITVNIGLHVDITALKAIITTTANSSLASTDDVIKNFTTSQTYTVNAEDGVTSKTYTVTVNHVSDVYPGPFPYISDMNPTYDDPVWITGGGEGHKAPYQPQQEIAGDCKTTLGAYRMSELGGAGTVMTFRTSQCGKFKVGISATGMRNVVLSNNINTVKDTIKVQSNECGYGEIVVNSFSETELYLTEITATAGTNVFYVEITAASVTENSLVKTSNVNIYAQEGNVIIDAESGIDYNIVNISGVNVATGKTVMPVTAIPLRKGVYIVIMEGKSHKVIVY